MAKTAAEIMKEYVRSQNFTSTDEIMAAMKDMFKDVLQEVICVNFKNSEIYSKIISLFYCFLMYGFILFP